VEGGLVCEGVELSPHQFHIIDILQEMDHTSSQAFLCPSIILFFIFIFLYPFLFPVIGLFPRDFARAGQPIASTGSHVSACSSPRLATLGGARARLRGTCTHRDPRLGLICNQRGMINARGRVRAYTAASNVGEGR
jgi:hypothetical protein